MFYFVSGQKLLSFQTNSISFRANPQRFPGPKMDWVVFSPYDSGPPSSVPFHWAWKGKPSGHTMKYSPIVRTTDQHSRGGCRHWTSMLACGERYFSHSRNLRLRVSLDASSVQTAQETWASWNLSFACPYSISMWAADWIGLLHFIPFQKIKASFESLAAQIVRLEIQRIESDKRCSSMAMRSFCPHFYVTLQNHTKTEQYNSYLIFLTTICPILIHWGVSASKSSLTKTRKSQHLRMGCSRIGIQATGTGVTSGGNANQNLFKMKPIHTKADKSC